MSFLFYDYAYSYYICAIELSSYYYITSNFSNHATIKRVEAKWPYFIRRAKTVEKSRYMPIV